MKRGYFGVGIFNGKNVTNIGTQYSLADDLKAYKEKDAFDI